VVLDVESSSIFDQAQYPSEQSTMSIERTDFNDLHRLSLRVENDIAFFTFGDLQELQDQTAAAINDQHEATLKNTESFTPYFGYDVQLLAKYPGLPAFGILFNTISTGAWSRCSDYSGLYTYDYTYSANSYGFLTEFSLRRYRNPDMFIGCKALYMKVNLDIDYSHYLYPREEKETYEYTTTGLGVEPYLAFQYLLGPVIARLNCSYFLSRSQELKDADGVYLTDSVGNRVKPDWQGFKAGLSVGFAF
jgi:hypothetical protein